VGEHARKKREETERSIRDVPLTDQQRDFLRAHARYEGSPLHKKEPHNFDLTPPTSPRIDKTLCDEAGIVEKRVAFALFARAIDVGLVSAKDKVAGYPAQMWVVDADGRVFEMIYGGSREGRYHGYPIRRTNLLFNQILTAWAARRHG
jgi:hypothetical protein